MKKFFSVLISLFAVCSFAVTACGEAMTEDYDWLYKVKEDGTVAITTPAGAVDSGDVIIPSEIDGYTVSEISSYCFSLQTGIFTAEIPSSVKVLGSNAFSHCYGLSTVSFGYNFNTASGGTQIIGESAFMNCHGLQAVYFPADLKVIEEYSFANCTALSSVNLPYGAETIGKGAFADCTALTSVFLPESIKELGDDVFENCPPSMMVYYEGSKEKWEKVEKNENEFTDIAVTFALTELPDDPIEEYGNVDGFSYRISVDGTAELRGYFGDETDFVVPSDINGYPVSKIGFACFPVNGGVRSVEIPSSVKVLEECFVYCSSLEQVILHDGLEIIDYNTFKGCEKLESITIPSTVREIGDSAFEDCTSLKEVVIPDSVVTIGDRAFGDCVNIEKLTLGKNIKEMGEYCFVNCEKITSAEIPEGITVVEVSLFHNCSDLEYIVIPDSVEVIRGSAFFGCYSLDRVLYKGSETDWKNTDIGIGNGRLKDSVLIYNYDPATYKPAGPGIAIILCSVAVLVPVAVVIILLLRRRKVCPDCGRELDENSKFCGSCGRKL